MDILVLRPSKTGQRDGIFRKVVVETYDMDRSIEAVSLWVLTVNFFLAVRFCPFEAWQQALVAPSFVTNSLRPLIVAGFVTSHPGTGSCQRKHDQIRSRLTHNSLLYHLTTSCHRRGKWVDCQHLVEERSCRSIAVLCHVALEPRRRTAPTDHCEHPFLPQRGRLCSRGTFVTVDWRGHSQRVLLQQ